MTQTPPLRDLLDLGRSILLAQRVRVETACRLAQQVQVELLQMVQQSLELSAAEWSALDPEFITDTTPDAVLCCLQPPLVALRYGNYRCFVSVPLELCGCPGSCCEVKQQEHTTESELVLYYAWDMTPRPCTRNELALWLAYIQDAQDNDITLVNEWERPAELTWGERLYADVNTVYQALEKGDTALGQARALALMAEALIRLGQG